MPSDTGLHEGEGKDQERLDKSKKQSASSKTAKDLSHVPCKFFKVGGCTAGSSCPFSHSSAEPGSQKEACTWFVKGNCKFGHKCALAHILPGQSMAMDRKNKKAAQAAANAGGGGGGTGPGSGVSGGEKSKTKPLGRRDGHSTGGRLPLLAGGSTAPTRILGSGSNSSSRPPMGVPLKAAISPSAPAPALNDNDFTSFSIDGMDSPTAQSSSNNDDNTQTTGSSTDDLDTADSTPTATGTTGGAGTTTTTIPTSAARSSAASSNPAANSSPTPDFGPIGSPPNYRNPTSPTKALNGSSSNTPAATAIDLSTSPRAQGHLPSNLTLSSNNQYRNGLPSSPPISSSLSNQAIDFMSTSPFSAPGNQSVFMTGNYSPMPNVGVPASLGALPLLSGAGRASKSSGWGEKGEYDISIEYDEFTGTTASAGARSGLAMRRMRDERDSAVEDEDLDLLPGSLSDLLTPEERKRRMSRNGQQGRGDAGLRELREGMGMMGIGNNNNAASQGQEAGGMLGHRYSRSVPAPTLLSDIKSIWADSNTGLPSSPARSGLAAGAPSAGSATGGVFGSPFAATPDDALSSAGLPGSLGGGGFVGGTPSSVGMMSLSPSNASAAFLPGLHRHYSNAKAKAASQAQAQAQQLGLGAGAGAGGLSRQMRGASGPSLLSANAASGAGANNSNTNSLASNYLLSSLQAGLPSSAGAASTLHGSMAGGGTGGAVHTHTHGGTQTTYRTTPSPFDLTGGMRRGGIGATLGSGGGLDSTSTSLNPLSSNMGMGMGGLGSGYGMGAGGGLGGNGAGGMGPSVALSPGTKALHAHAPGQSLPQGLAAGYSRIHALPPVNLRDIVGSASSSSGLGGAGLSGSYTGGGVPSSFGAAGGGLMGIDEMGMGEVYGRPISGSLMSGGGDWRSGSPYQQQQQHYQQQSQLQQQQQQQQQEGAGATGGAPGKMSYSAVASGAAASTGPTRSPPPTTTTPRPDNASPAPGSNSSNPTSAASNPGANNATSPPGLSRHPQNMNPGNGARYMQPMMGGYGGYGGYGHAHHHSMGSMGYLPMQVQQQQQHQGQQHQQQQGGQQQGGQQQGGGHGQGPSPLGAHSVTKEDDDLFVME